MIIIVDYGMGNLGSVANMMRRIGAKAKITGSLEEIEQADKIILPGVGAFDHAMQRIQDTGLREILDKKALTDKVPILGICLGMQLLTSGSDEGHLPGLGWIAARTNSFRNAFNTQDGATKKLKVPHMGWNMVRLVAPKCPLLEGFEGETRFYFVHSYYVKCDDPSNSIMKTHYGVEFDAAIWKGNIYGAQFHPEKSHKFGMRFLSNFNNIS